MTNLQIDEVVNLAGYPIADGANPARAALIDRCRADLAANQFCALPGFVTPTALSAMAAEAGELLPNAYHNNATRNCYLHRQGDPTFPPDHARNLMDRSSVRMIAYDQVATESPLKTFYHSPIVRDLVADIIGEGELYDNEDPHQPANYVCYRHGDESSWHFDSGNSFTMTLMIQAADAGGEFQMSPNTRTDSHENYDHVATVLRGGEDDQVVSIARDVGELCLFRGCNSLHRVAPVAGATVRIMGVFVYEFTPGVIGDPEVNATIYGPRTR